MLDTNALLLPFRGGIDLAAEVERLVPGAVLLVPQSALAELDRLCARRVDFAEAARALARTLPTVPSSGRGDTAVLRAASDLGATVVTADRAFAERLRRHGVATLVPRDRDRLHRLAGERLPPLPGRARGKG